jgi:hypothetical protein
VGSLIGGSLLAFGWSIANIFLLLAVPAVAASLAVFAMGRSRQRPHTAMPD